MNVARVFLIATALGACCACAEVSNGKHVDPATVLAMPSPWPTPQISTPNDAPRIIALWMNETTIPTGSDWNGRAVTSTNVASLEIRTESFSFVADRTSFGEFRFSQHVLDMIPFYKRRYVLRAIARNTGGAQTEWDVPIEFR